MSEPRLIAVGKQIRKAREAQGWTQAYLADKLGITRQTLIAMEKGRGIRPNLHRLERLERLIGCSLIGSIGSDALTVTQDGIVVEEQHPPQVEDVVTQLKLIPGEHQTGAIHLVMVLLKWYETEFVQKGYPNA